MTNRFPRRLQAPERGYPAASPSRHARNRAPPSPTSRAHRKPDRAVPRDWVIARPFPLFRTYENIAPMGRARSPLPSGGLFVMTNSARIRSAPPPILRPDENANSSLVRAKSLAPDSFVRTKARFPQDAGSIPFSFWKFDRHDEQIPSQIAPSVGGVPLPSAVTDPGQDLNLFVMTNSTRPCGEGGG